MSKSLGRSGTKWWGPQGSIYHWYLGPPRNRSCLGSWVKWRIPNCSNWNKICSCCCNARIFWLAEAGLWSSLQSCRAYPAPAAPFYFWSRCAFGSWRRPANPLRMHAWTTLAGKGDFELGGVSVSWWCDFGCSPGQRSASNSASPI